MASTGLILAGAGSSNPPGDDAWSSPGNITANDNVDASCAIGKNDESYYLLASDFGFSIPDGSVINGVTVTIERAASDANRVEEVAVQLYMTGDLSIQNKATATLWPITDTSQNYGGAADTWGESLTSALVNVSTFGVVIKVGTINGATAYVDWVGMNIDYTPPGGQPYDLHEGGVMFVNPHSGGQNFNVFRKMLGWRKSLSGLLLPPDPLEGLRHG